MANPRLLRRKVLADAADPDWAGTQVAPVAALTVDTTFLKRIVVTPVVRDAMGAIVAGEVQLQLVASAGVQAPQGEPAQDLVWAAPAESAGTGDALVYDVGGIDAVTMRVVDASAVPTAATIDLFWLPVSVSS